MQPLQRPLAQAATRRAQPRGWAPSWAAIGRGLEPVRSSRLAAPIAGRPLHLIARYMPTGLYPRALVIVIAPVVLLQSVIAYVFMERHWQTGDAAPVLGRVGRHRRR